MKPEQHPDDRGALRHVLNEWKVESSLPPRFGDRVWERIGAAEGAATDPAAALWAWVAGIFRRPLPASAYLGVLLVAGSTLGFWQGHVRSERSAAELGTRYVQMLDPYQMPRH
jgi:hypothetical protein